MEWSKFKNQLIKIVKLILKPKLHNVYTVYNKMCELIRWNEVQVYVNVPWFWNLKQKKLCDLIVY